MRESGRDCFADREGGRNSSLYKFDLRVTRFYEILNIVFNEHNNEKYIKLQKVLKMHCFFLELLFFTV